MSGPTRAPAGTLNGRAPIPRATSTARLLPVGAGSSWADHLARLGRSRQPSRTPRGTSPRFFTRLD